MSLTEILQFVTLLSLQLVVDGFPNGAPQKSCFSMSPVAGHKTNWAKPEDPVPYQVLVSNNKYAPGSHINGMYANKENNQFVMMQLYMKYYFKLLWIKG